MNSLAIIPARSGSKGLPDKNIRLLNGKPLLAYAIEAARVSGVFDEIMVSTDSSKYAEVAQKYGAEVPFIRSDKNADDNADSWSVVREVLEEYEKKGRQFSNFCLLQPTSPLRVGEDIKGAYECFYKRNATAVVSVCECEHSPLWCNVLDENMDMSNFISKDAGIQRQKLKKFYRINGAIYISDVKEFKKDSFLYKKGCYAYVMSSERSVDIDSLLDFKLAELIMNDNI